MTVYVVSVYAFVFAYFSYNYQCRLCSMVILAQLMRLNLCKILYCSLILSVRVFLVSC